MINRGYKYRLYLTDEMEIQFAQWAGATRAVYNCALMQKNLFGRDTKLGYVEQAKELKLLRDEFDWVAAVPQQCLQQALRDLHSAFSRFFVGKAGYPTNRRKFVNDSFRFPGRDADQVKVLNAKWAMVKLPKAVWVRFRLSRDMPVGTVKNVTVVKNANGWHVVFSMEMESKCASTEGLPSTAIDRGITNNVALATGELLSMPKAVINALDRRHRAAQRDMSKRQRGSIRYKRARKRAAALKAKVARVRLHWQHETTTMIADRFNVVVLENLKTQNMMASASGTVEEAGTNVAQKRGLNRSIAGAAWHQFETLQSYKLEERNGLAIFVNPAYTSRTCAKCGSRRKENRENQAKFSCVDCGHQDHADTNAAINILRAGTRPAAGDRRGLKRAA